MTKDIYAMVSKANAYMKEGTLEENDKLFLFVSNILLDHNMYHGYNFYQKLTIDGKEFLALCDADKDHQNEKGQFVEKQTDIRQFYLR